MSDEQQQLQKTKGVAPGNSLVPSTEELTNMRSMAGHLAHAGFWKDAQEPNAAMAKLLVGRDLGLPPTMALSEIHVIKGKPVLSAALLGALVKRTGKYRWRIEEHTDLVCTMTFLERVDGTWVECGPSTFSIEDAKRAGLMRNDNWKNYPRNMLFARALSNGVKFYAPDAVSGGAYVEGELDEAEVVSVRKEASTVRFMPEAAAAWAIEQGAFAGEHEAALAAARALADKRLSVQESRATWMKLVRDNLEQVVEDAVLVEEPAG